MRAGVVVVWGRRGRCGAEVVVVEALRETFLEKCLFRVEFGDSDTGLEGCPRGGVIDHNIDVCMYTVILETN